MTKRSAVWRIKPEFLTPEEERLIKKCARSTEVKPSTLYVSELGRVGKSGARLLNCHLGRNSIPFVIKIDKTGKILREFAAMKEVKNYFRDATTPGRGPARDDNLAALIYWHHGGDTHQQIESSKELRDIVFCLKNRGRGERGCPSDRDVQEVFTRLIERLDNARQARVMRRFKYISEYRPYLRDFVSTAVLKCVFGGRHTLDHFEFLGADIVNPIAFLESPRMNEPIRGYFGPIHGDLHPNNVIIDNQGAIHLIDFAWAAPQRHLLKDYVLMECSLRFLLFPHYVNLEEQLRVDRLLLSADGPEHLEELGSSSELAQYYVRLGKVLSVLRRGAMKVLADQSDGAFLEYLTAQFLVLYGLLRYNDYNRLVATRALGLIAKELAGAYGIKHS